MNYGGDLSATQCWELMQKDPSAILVDVRTKAEWSLVGIPAVAPDRKQLILAEWQQFPDMSVNADFLDQVTEELSERGASNSIHLLFMCKGGVRSLAAARAMTANGYPNTFNMIGGFEGPVDENGHRGLISGWKAEELPWRQS